MIRAWIGRFVLGCIKAHKGREFARKVARVDLTKLTDQQISDFVHGRAIDWTTAEPTALQPARRGS